MTTILYLTTKYSKQSGGGKFSEAVFQGLSFLNDTRVVRYEIDTSSSFLTRLANALHGFIYGITRQTEEEIVAICEQEKVNVLFASYTYFGTLCRNLKSRIPGLRIVSLAQNVEYSYHRRLFNLSHDNILQGLLFIAAVKLNERRQLKSSDYLFALNTRDASEFQRIYGKYPDSILGIILPDEYIATNNINDLSNEEFALFVGSRFPPNEYAVRWIAEHIAPKSPLNIKIVGKGLEAMRDELQNTPNLTIVGTVDDLTGYYNKARFIISPIFQGSGMKVKTAEALMYGKRILATDESLEGYDTANLPDVIRCQTSQEFIEAMLLSLDCPRYCALNRDIYLKNHSMPVLVKKLSRAVP